MIFNPPKQEGVCDKCAGELYQRSDDTEEKVGTRLDEYMNKTAPLLEYYETKGILREVNGEQEIDAVTARNQFTSARSIVMIICKSEAELDLMREAGRIVAETHRLLAKAIQPGITTKELDQIAEELYSQSGCNSIFQRLQWFSWQHLCFSQRRISSWYSRSSESLKRAISSVLISAHNIKDIMEIPPGHILSVKFPKSSSVCWKLPKIRFMRDLQLAKPDVRLFTLSHAIQKCIEEAGFSVVREYVGHGIGADLHEEPQIPNYGIPDVDPIKPGMVLAIEPMVNVGERYVKTLEDNWTVVTVDGSLMCSF